MAYVHNIRYVMLGYVNVYVTLRCIMFMFATHIVYFRFFSDECRKFLSLNFRYDAQMSGSRTQHLRRKKCFAAQGGKTTPFSFAG